jgi:hypothetical protein
LEKALFKCSHPPPKYSAKVSSGLPVRLRQQNYAKQAKPMFQGGNI